MRSDLKCPHCGADTDRIWVIVPVPIRFVLDINGIPHGADSPDDHIYAYGRSYDLEEASYHCMECDKDFRAKQCGCCNKIMYTKGVYAQTDGDGDWAGTITRFTCDHCGRVEEENVEIKTDNEVIEEGEEPWEGDDADGSA